ncbi:MAG: diacylglycerol kinase family protein [Polyangiaceae bacterium]
MRRRHLVINAKARGHQTRTRWVSRMQRLARGQLTVHVTESLDDLERVSDLIAESDPELVAISGGDGSLMAGVTALHRRLEHLPVIAPLRAGTAGTVARNWGASPSPLKSLERLLARRAEITLRASLRVTTPEAPPRLGFIFGTGLVARFFRIYDARGAPGNRGAARIVARILAESFYGGPMAEEVLTPLPCRLTIDGQPCGPDAWSLVACATVKNLGLHMLVTHRAEEDPSRPHLVASCLPPASLGPRIGRVLLGQHIGGQDHVDRLVSRFAIAFDTCGPWVLDGELFASPQVEVAAGPELRVAT